MRVVLVRGAVDMRLLGESALHGTHAEAEERRGLAEGLITAFHVHALGDQPARAEAAHRVRVPVLFFLHTIRLAPVPVLPTFYLQLPLPPSAFLRVASLHYLS